MLSRSELEEIARTHTRGNVGHTEKLYCQDVILRTISRDTTDELVFKGGTALLKCYQLDRFSEDLDFTAREPIQFENVVTAAVRDLEQYGMAVDRQSVDRTERSHSARVGIEGPLYTGEERSLCYIRLQVNTHSSVEDVRIERYTPLFRDIPTFDLPVLSEREILAEKIRALMTRRQPRDLYDLYHLVERSAKVDPALIQSKLDYYGLVYEPEAVRERARSFDVEWSVLEPLVYSQLPPFETVIKSVEEVLTDDATPE